METRERRLILRLFRGADNSVSVTSGYRAMWVVVVFDLPVGTTAERRHASRFRNMLIGEGFFMKQFSVYMRYFNNRTQAEAAADRIGGRVPRMGTVSILFLTDKQFALMRNYDGKATAEPDRKPNQLALF